MFDAPMDGLVLWTGIALVSLAAFGVAASLPGSMAPDAGALADRIDDVSTSPYSASTTISHDVAELRVQRSQLSVRGPGGTSHATLVGASVTPVRDRRLRRVLEGRNPKTVFDSRRAFARQLSVAQQRTGEWHAVPDRLRVRRVVWGDVNATLVG